MSVQIAGLCVAITSAIVAVMALVFSVRIGRKNHRIANQAAKMASEQESIRRALKKEVLQGLLATYQSLSDFNDYLWLVKSHKYEVDRDFVYNFYIDRANDLSKIRSTSSYYEFQKGPPEATGRF